MCTEGAGADSCLETLTTGRQSPSDILEAALRCVLWCSDTCEQPLPAQALQLKREEARLILQANFPQLAASALSKALTGAYGSLGCNFRQVSLRGQTYRTQRRNPRPGRCAPTANTLLLLRSTRCLGRFVLLFGCWLSPFF